MNEPVTVPTDKLTDVLAAHPNVLAAWLFGSAREGGVRAGGDVDIGVWFESKPGFDEWAGLASELQRVVPDAEVDLTTLNDASPILRFEAVCGRPLLSRDDQRRAGFVSLTAREYEDVTGMVSRYL